MKKPRRMPVEVAVRLDDILLILGWSRKKFFLYRKELVDAGVIFYSRRGRPYRRMIFGFPSRLRSWISLKASKGEDI